MSLTVKVGNWGRRCTYTISNINDIIFNINEDCKGNERDLKVLIEIEINMGNKSYFINGNLNKIETYAVHHNSGKKENTTRITDNIFPITEDILKKLFIDLIF